MENQISLKDNLGYASLLFLGWALLCMCFVPQLFAEGTPHGYIYITIFLFAGTGTGGHYMISFIVVDIVKRLKASMYKGNHANNFDCDLERSKSIVDWIKKDKLELIMKSEFWDVYFNQDGSLKADAPEYYTPLDKQIKIHSTKYTIIGTLFSYLKENDLLTQEYTWKQLIKISGRLFEINSSIKNSMYHDENLKKLIRK